MEIKCKVSFTLPEQLIDALDIDEDTPIVASLSGNRVVIEIIDEEDDSDTDRAEDDFYEEDDDCGFDCYCDECEYYCPHCGSCTLD